MKDRLSIMRHDKRVLIVKKKVPISKDLNVLHAWNVIAPIVAREIGAPDYIPVPNFYTNAYQIGHIFVPTSMQVTCFRAVPVLKVLGPIRDFAVEADTDVKWLDKKFHGVQTSGDQTDFHIIIESGRNYLSCTGENYCFLSKADNMSTPRNVTINRAAHEDLCDTKWIGLITNVIVTQIFELHIAKDVRERTIGMSDNIRTVFFKYEICEIDKSGVVVNSEVKKIPCKWLPIEKELDGLPFTEFQSAAGKTRTSLS